MVKVIILLPYYFLKDILLCVGRLFKKGTITGQQVLITGAGGGIGAEFALQFAKMGNTVHCLDVNANSLDQTVKGLTDQGHNAFAYKCDLTKVDEIQQIADGLKQKNVKITVLVNNAGVASYKEILEMSPTKLSQCVTVNLIAPMWTTQIFLPHMQELGYGHIINVASIAGFLSVLRTSPEYSPAKAGLINFARQLEIQLPNNDIKITTVCPHFVNTNMIKDFADNLKRIGALCEATDVVAASIESAAKGVPLLVYPKSANLLCILQHFIPTSMAKKFSQIVLDDSM